MFLDTVSQKVKKKDGPKPSGVGLESLFMVAKVTLISSWEKGALKLSARGRVLG